MKMKEEIMTKLDEVNVCPLKKKSISLVFQKIHLIERLRKVKQATILE